MLRFRQCPAYASGVGLIPVLGNVMTNQQDIDRYFSGSIYRVLSGLFGLFLTAVGIYVVFFGVVDPLIRVGLGVLIAALGAETVWSAIRSKQSWLARLGPFT